MESRLVCHSLIVSPNPNLCTTQLIEANRLHGDTAIAAMNPDSDSRFGHRGKNSVQIEKGTARQSSTPSAT
jgi:hypothetical protein